MQLPMVSILFYTAVSALPAKHFIARTPSLQATLEAVAPSAKSCEGAPIINQCRTASQAAGLIAQSFQTYGIATVNEQAALISLMAFESDEFKYNTNISPGRPGQGTRNMQMAEFNLKYAQSVPALANQLANTVGSATVDSFTPDQLNGIRSLLTSNDTLDFGSAAWFLITQCSPSIRQGLQTGGAQGWQNYITTCVGTTVTTDRQNYYSIAVQALGST